MRTIKFRAKVLHKSTRTYIGSAKQDGEWVYGDLHLLTMNPHIHTDTGHKEPIDPETVGQFTDLFDKNGKEIYEGDIVKHPYIDPIFRDLVESEDGEGVTSEVVFHDAAFVVKYDVNDFVYLDGFTRHGHVEVIGNIHDNPELIQKYET